MIDDILYGEIHPNNSKRIVNRRINDQIEVEFEVTTKDGEEQWDIKSITVDSKNSKVIVDSRTIHDPNPPVYQDECYYLKDCYLGMGVREPATKIWVPSDFGYVGMNRK